MSTSFDRLRVRDIEHVESRSPAPVDPNGRSALFSQPSGAPRRGHVAITCSTCRERRVLNYLAALWQAIPGLHVPLVRRPHDWWLRCPACNGHHWVSVAFR